MPALVEIVLPIYNPTETVYEAIDSVVGQTFQDWHLTIVDDCSPKNIGGELQSRYSDNSRITYVRLDQNLRAAGARNLIISSSESEFFALQDQDDLWLPHKLEKQVAFFNSLPENVGAIHGDIEIINAKGDVVPAKADEENRARSRVNWVLPPKGLQKEVFLASNIRLITSMIRRSSFQEIGGFDTTLTGDEDWEFWVRFSHRFGIRHDAQILIYRRIHDKNVSKTSGASRNIDTLKVLEKIRSANYPITPELFAEKEYRIYATIIRFLRLNMRVIEAASFLIKYVKSHPLRVVKNLKLIWYLIFGARVIL